MNLGQTWMPWCVLGGGVVAALLLFFAPGLPQWGEYHAPQESLRSQQLRSGQALTQTFTFEHPALDGVRLMIDTHKEIPRSGNLEVKITTKDRTVLQSISLQEVDEAGNLFVWFPSIRGSEGEMALSLGATDIPVYFRYQIDATKYEGGNMAHSARHVEGDLAFALHYQRPALGTMGRQFAYAALIIVAAAGTAWGLRQQWWGANTFERQDYLWAAGVGLVVFGWYAAWLVRGGVWIGPGDFVKDVSYIQASADALSLGAWPMWSHLICGGMPLLGNPESNALSAGTLLAFAVPPEKALWLLLAIEAGVGAAGSFLLARSFGISRQGSVLAALVPTLSGAYAYRIVEGFTMIGAAVAGIPWVLLGLWQSWRGRGVGWAIVAGLTLTAIFWRGEVHILTGLLLTVGVVALTATFVRKSWQPVAMLAVAGAVFFLGGSVKLLAYAEQPQFFSTTYRPYVAPLISSGIFDDVFLQVHDRFYPVDVEHGKSAEEWGNFGAYVGWVVILLAVVGVWRRKHGWWIVLFGFGITLVLAEGSVFAWWLAGLGPLGGLLRLPTRLLAITLVYGGVMAGGGVDRLLSLAPRKAGIGIALVLIGVAAGDMMGAQASIFSKQLSHRTSVPYRSQDTPTAAFHRNAGLDDSRHAGVLLAQGYILPRLCADVAAEPDFTAKRLDDVFPITDVPARLLPNRIRLSSVGAGRSVRIAERFVPGAVATGGVAYEGVEGEIIVDSAKEGAFSETDILYASASRRTQQFLFILMLGIAAVVLLLPHREVS